MTPEMAFECLLVTPDPATLNALDGILQDFSIATRVCRSPSDAANVLGECSPDLLVIDLEDRDSCEFLRQTGTLLRQKPIVLALSAADSAIPGAHVTLRKPVTHESGMSSVRAAYSRMVRDYRKHTRFAVMKAVLATDESNRAISMTVTNVGEGGVGLTTTESLRIGGTLSFRLPLPDLNVEISVEARVLWTRPYGAAGCEFVNVPPFDVQLLHAWLDSRYRIKKPLIPV